MKKIIIIMLILVGVNSLFAQVATKVYEKGKAFDKPAPARLYRVA